MRKEVIEFAEAMEIKLQKYDGIKKSWKETDNEYLYSRLMCQLYELDRCTRLDIDDAEAAETLINISNFAMMLRDNILNRKEGDDGSQQA